MTLKNRIKLRRFNKFIKLFDNSTYIRKELLFINDITAFFVYNSLEEKIALIYLDKQEWLIKFLVGDGRALFSTKSSRKAFRLIKKRDKQHQAEKMWLRR